MKKTKSRYGLLFSESTKLQFFTQNKNIISLPLDYFLSKLDVRP